MAGIETGFVDELVSELVDELVVGHGDCNTGAVSQLWPDCGSFPDYMSADAPADALRNIR